MSSNQVDPGIKEDSLWSAKLIAGLGFGAARTVRPARSSSSSPGANPAVTRAFGRRWWVYDSATRGPARTRFIGERAASARQVAESFAGAAKAAQALRPGGRLAVFWNAFQP